MYGKPSGTPYWEKVSVSAILLCLPLRLPLLRCCLLQLPPSHRALMVDFVRGAAAGATRRVVRVVAVLLDEVG